MEPARDRRLTDADPERSSTTAAASTRTCDLDACGQPGQVDLVGGTVDSHNRPITIENTITVVGVCGRSRKAVTAMERPI